MPMRHVTAIYDDNNNNNAMIYSSSSNTVIAEAALTCHEEEPREDHNVQSLTRTSPGGEATDLT